MFGVESDGMIAQTGGIVHMKERNVCPKCNSQDILMVPGKAGAYGTGNNIQVGMTNFSAVPVNRYVCCNCGYSEEWIDKKNLPILKRKYEI